MDLALIYDQIDSNYILNALKFRKFSAEAPRTSLAPSDFLGFFGFKIVGLINIKAIIFDPVAIYLY